MARWQIVVKKSEATKQRPKQQENKEQKTNKQKQTNKTKTALCPTSYAVQRPTIHFSLNLHDIIIKQNHGKSKTQAIKRGEKMELNLGFVP